MSRHPPLCIIAGKGDLPWRLYDAARRDRVCHVLALRGYCDKKRVSQLNDNARWVSLTAIVSELRKTKEAGVTQLVMAGAVRRPSLLAMTRWDRATWQLAKKILTKGRGDDHLLRLIIHQMEQEGFKVLGVKNIVGEELMAQRNFYNNGFYPSIYKSDIAAGLEAVRHVSAADIGQSIIVQQGQVVAVEGLEGTDELIKRCKRLLRKGRGGVFFKFKKKDQDERVDLPTIGVSTITHCVRSGIDGLALEEGGVIILDEAAVMALCERHGLFITTFAPFSS